MPDPTTQLMAPHLGERLWLGDESPLEGQIGQPPPPSLLKDIKEGASATVAGSLFQSGIVLGKKLFL